ncbi:NERD domain-containing protein [Nocardia grenadensis]|uniref:NERD domain-containing protein n=1 Tax=Nocardia grenadensis TaxID=931537 RepID=UPI003D8E6A6A
MARSDERWIEVSKSAFPHEAEGLAMLRNIVPDAPPYRAWTNFEFMDNHGQWHEIDALVLGRRRLHLIELKHYTGVLQGTEANWVRTIPGRNKRRTQRSPLLLTRRKAQRLATRIDEEARKVAQEFGLGPEAEKHFGRRHFMDLLAVFTAAPEFTVFAGRQEIGTVGTTVLTDPIEGPRILLLAGRSWQVTHIDWKRRQVYVETTDIPGRAKWSSVPDGASFAITRGVRDVLLGALPTGVTLTKRAAAPLADQRLVRAEHVADGAFLIVRNRREDWHWWTWAGSKVNRTLAAWATDLVPTRQRIGAESLRLHPDLTVADIRAGLSRLRSVGGGPQPEVDSSALQGLKFSATLPKGLAHATLTARMSDTSRARSALAERTRVASTK